MLVQEAEARLCSHFGTAAALAESQDEEPGVVEIVGLVIPASEALPGGLVLAPSWACSRAAATSPHSRGACMTYCTAAKLDSLYTLGMERGIWA
mmetsp:Transcript_545/g.1864  ORF Transcript_545/g.1864 Transcript_545/m.1864 type:complete len:94 (-) Transcript_545:2-283(-)